MYNVLNSNEHQSTRWMRVITAAITEKKLLLIPAVCSVFCTKLRWVFFYVSLFIEDRKPVVFSFLIQWQNMSRSVYRRCLNVCDLTESDRRPESFCGKWGRHEFIMCLFWTWKTQNMLRRNIKAWEKRSFPPIHTFTETHIYQFLSHHWMQFNYLTPSHFLSAPRGGQGRKMRATERKRQNEQKGGRDTTMLRGGGGWGG